MQFLWDEDLYEKIIESIESGMKQTKQSLVFDISSAKYNSFVKTVQEKYQINGQAKQSYSFYLVPFKNGSNEAFITTSKLYAHQK